MAISLASLVSILALAASSQANIHKNVASKYTDLSPKSCKKQIDDKLTGAFSLLCPGVYGFNLRVLEDDGRGSINIVTADNRTYPLNYWDVVTRGFLTLGTKAEWRIRYVDGKPVPAALIVRIRTIDQSNPDHVKPVPLLVVSKIGKDAACVTHVIDGTSASANEQARLKADDLQTECLPNETKVSPPTKG
jgi:hypothetical protein